MFAAHDTADVVNHLVVGDDGHARIERIGFAVECFDLFAVPRLARYECTGQLRPVIDVQGTAKVYRDEIGDVDQQRDWLLADGLQFLAHPFGRCAVGDARNGLRVKCRAAFDIECGDVGRGIASLDRRDCTGFVDFSQRAQRAQTCRRQIARDASHTHAVLPVRRYADIENRIVKPSPIGIDLADRRIARQFNDAIIIVAKLKLGNRAHHAVRFDAAYRRDLKHHAIGWHCRARRTEYAEHPGARIRCTADDLQRFAASIYRQHLQLVGLRMRRGSKHLCDAKRGQFVSRIFNAFNLKPDAVKAISYSSHIGARVEMLLEPAQREFHGDTPPLSVGTSSAPNP